MGSSDSFVFFIAGWSSPVARQAHNLKVASSNLAPAPNEGRFFKIKRPSPFMEWVYYF